MAPLRKASFAAAADHRARVLILGSLPGEASLAQAQYYAHPRNQFWLLLGAVIGRPLAAAPYAERLAAAVAAGVALWDVVGSAERQGSLDAAIRNPTANALKDFAATLPDLRAVAFNGGKAAELGAPLLAGGPYALVPLPSSSPAHAVAFETKVRRWLALRAFLADDA